MKYKYKLTEQEMDGDNARQQTSYDLVLTPTTLSTEEVIKALENIDNYGAYVSNLRNSTMDVNKAIEAHFGPSQPFTKKKLEKERGKPFPIKTKQAVDSFIKTLTSKPNLLNWIVKDTELIFPNSKNPTKKVTQNIIDTVMNNAGIEYNLTDKETIDENSLKELIKEIIRKNTK
jgi:hypothetical protein